MSCSTHSPRRVASLSRRSHRTECISRGDAERPDRRIQPRQHTDAQGSGVPPSRRCERDIRAPMLGERNAEREPISRERTGRRPPSPQTMAASVMNCTATCPRVAPMARRRPISDRRSRTATTMILAMPTPPTSKETEPSTSEQRRQGLVCRCSGGRSIGGSADGTLDRELAGEPFGPEPTGRRRPAPGSLECRSRSGSGKTKELCCDRPPDERRPVKTRVRAARDRGRRSPRSSDPRADLR